MLILIHMNVATYVFKIKYQNHNVKVMDVIGLTNLIPFQIQSQNINYANLLRAAINQA